MTGPGSIPNGFFWLHVVRSLMPILALLPFLCIAKKDSINKVDVVILSSNSECHCCRRYFLRKCCHKRISLLFLKPPEKSEQSALLPFGKIVFYIW